MAPLRQRSVIVLDGDDNVDDDLIVLDHAEASYPSGTSKAVKPMFKSGNTPYQQTLSAQQVSKAKEETLTSKSPDASAVSPFGHLDWSSKSTISDSMAPIETPFPASRFSSLSSESRHRVRSRTLSLSPTAETLRASLLGTAREPIELLADDSRDDLGDLPRSGKRRGARDSGSYSTVSKHGANQKLQYILLDDDDEDGDEPPNALVRSLGRHPTADDELIDLEDIEDALLEADDQLFQVEEGQFEEAKGHDGRKPSQAVKTERRNPDIVFPFVRKESIKHLGSTIMPNKTVELRDGSFLRITDVFLNTETKVVMLRGHRLQRTREMDGMLEKKINECLLFLEVDKDDQRDPLRQAVVEAPLSEVVQIRSVRCTNATYPLNRNLHLNDFNGKMMAQETGGLTARWKYTCQYGSAIKRHHNKHNERSLERLIPDECTKGYSTTDAARRFKWRGKTILGGAYQPFIDRGETIHRRESREGSVVSIKSSPMAKDFARVHVHSIDDSLAEDDRDLNRTSERWLGTAIAKRKHSDVAGLTAQTSWCGQTQKKIKRAEEESVEETRERMSRMSLQAREKRMSDTKSKFIDLSLPLSVDLTLPDLSEPPAMGSIRTKSQSPLPRTARTAGQRYTFGDGFCGGGGATRGAIMAGFEPRWGFDHWEHACETWRANFQHATCYHEDAHSFVQFAKRRPDLVKVDILHLSPPCQFFSPAHTINGRDDEMNTASLFAVLEVIRVSRPRIVTLEQTFGLCHPRFRFYFNALIHMFTAQDFSVRWAIIPLAQWGLPARRMRLIMIAACPGEILPRMPAATHSESGSATLKPFTSAQSVLSSIPRPSRLRPDPLHDPAAVTFPPNKCLTPYNATKILPRAITTSGGGNWHPSGKRDFTRREYAALQGFPECHIFKGKAIKKQIGNAVPPCIAKVLFESIKKDLSTADGVEDGAEFIG